MLLSGKGMMPLVVAQSRLVVQMAQICNMINTTHTHTHIKSARISHASQQCCKWPRIWFAAVEVFRGIKCNLNKEATSSLSLSAFCCLSLYLYFTYTHTHTIIDRSTRQNADWMWFVSLSLSLTTHTSNLLGFLMLHSSVANGRGFGSQRWKYFEELDVIWTRKQRKVALHSFLSYAPHRSLALSLSLYNFCLSLSLSQYLFSLSLSLDRHRAHQFFLDVVRSGGKYFGGIKYNLNKEASKVALHSLLFSCSTAKENWYLHTAVLRGAVRIVCCVSPS